MEHYHKRRKGSNASIFLVSPAVEPNALHELVKANKLEAIKHLLEEHAVDINAYDKRGYTALHYAFHPKFAVAIAKTLLEHGANANLPTLEDQKTLLHLAAYSNKPKLVKLLLDYQADQDLRDKDDKTPLYLACETQHFQVAHTLLALPINASNCLQALVQAEKTLEITRLLKEGTITTDINAYDAKGYTALHYAVYAKKGISIIHELLTYGADLNRGTHREQATPLHLAISCNRWSAIKLFVEKSADLNLKDHLGQTPLYLACEKDDHSPQTLKIATLLLQHGANPNYQADNGHNPLYCVVSNHNTDLFCLLLHYKADITVRDTFPTMSKKAPYLWGKTILHWAIYYHDLEIVQVLLDHNADIHARDNYCMMPIHEAANQGSLKMIRLLLHYGANLESRGQANKTALHLIAQQSNLELLTYCLNYPGVDSQAVDQSGWNALHFAASRSIKPEIIDLLVQARLSLESHTLQGLTPLHVAARCGNQAAFRTLLEKGADIQAVDHEGNNVCFHATLSGSREIINSLLNRQYDERTHNEICEMALYRAANSNHKSLVRGLLSHVGLQATDQNGWNVLHHAAINPQSSPVLKLLVSQGFNIEKITRSGQTVLHLAALHQNLGAIGYLLQHRINLYALDSVGQSAFQNAVEKSALCIMNLLYEHHLFTLLDLLNPLIDTQKVQIPTKIRQQIVGNTKHIIGDLRHDITSAVRHLLRQIINVEAAFEEDEWDFLLQENLNIATLSKQDWTPFQAATLSNADTITQYLYQQHLTLIHTLLRTNTSNIHTIHQNGWQLPHTILSYYKKQILQHLHEHIIVHFQPHHLRSGFSIHARHEAFYQEFEEHLDQYPWLKLESALSNNLRKIISLLDEASQIILNHQNDNGDSALLIAARLSTPSTLQWLLERGADPHMTNQNVTNQQNVGDTAIHCAAQSKYADTVLPLLYRKGVDIYQPNSLGATPLQVAILTHNERALKWLLEVAGKNQNPTLAHDIAQAMMPSTIQKFDHYLDLNSLDQYGNNILHTAADAGNLPMVDFLVHTFPHFCSQENQNKRTPLKEAIQAQLVHPHLPARPSRHCDREKVIALLWMQKRGYQRAHQASQEPSLYLLLRTQPNNTVLPQPNNTVLRTLVVMQNKAARKAAMQSALKQRGCISSKVGCVAEEGSFFYAKSKVIEAVTRLNPQEQSILLYTVKLCSEKLELPYEISIMIGHSLWEMITADSANRARMLDYPPVIEVFNPAKNIQEDAITASLENKKNDQEITPAQLYAGLESLQSGYSLLRA